MSLPEDHNVPVTELWAELIRAQQKLAEASGAVEALGRPDYAREFWRASQRIHELRFPPTEAK